MPEPNIFFAFSSEEIRELILALDAREETLKRLELVTQLHCSNPLWGQNYHDKTAIVARIRLLFQGALQ